MIVRRGVANFVLYFGQLVADDVHHPQARPQNIEIVGDFFCQLVQGSGDFLAAQAGQDVADANREWRAPALPKGGSVPSSFECVVGIGNQFDQRRHVARRPVAVHQSRARSRCVRGGADQMDHFVDIGDRNRQANLNMSAIARLVQQELRAPGNNFFAEIYEAPSGSP